MTTQLIDAPTGLAELCSPDDLEAGWGEAAWMAGQQIAVYRTESSDFYASSHHCPSTGAKVMARGILGDATVEGQRVATVACPLHKEIYRLDTGDCLSAPGTSLPVFGVHEHGGRLWIEESK
ncbi:nitrite reductase small subunit NirD [Glutamicibacter sp. NPDC087344]|uniref:nitrite reductase small subunit NirD n=1 Tax=Glutamicibacter sp. NPDC087344 TaxID=3363994 RepID=UPI0037F22C60